MGKQKMKCSKRRNDFTFPYAEHNYLYRLFSLAFGMAIPTMFHADQQPGH
jgi:hypothetical protein